MHNKFIYEGEYTDGTMEQLTANIISENMLSQVDHEFHHNQVLTEVTDHKRDDRNITKVNDTIET